MQDYWYADHRDLIKWGILLQLADSLNAGRILQLAFNPRTVPYDRLVIDGKDHAIPPEVLAHFRNLRTIGGVSTKVRVTVFDPPFTEKERQSHSKAACGFVSAFSGEHCIVFLDPDVGLEPQAGGTLKHVLEEEARQIWDAMKAGDVFALFQYQTNMAGKLWVEAKQEQLAGVLRVPPRAVKKAHVFKVAQDVPTDPKCAILYPERLHPVPHITNAPSRDEGDAKGT